MRQSSTKVWVLISDPSQHWFSVADALAEGHKRADLEKFDSLAEFARFKELLILQDLGGIMDLQCHPKFRISKRFDRHYSPDFTYYRLHRGSLVFSPLFDWAYNGVEITQHDDNLYWVLVAEDVKGITRKATSKGYVEAHLLRAESVHIFERFQEQNPQYLFELYPPLG